MAAFHSVQKQIQGKSSHFFFWKTNCRQHWFGKLRFFNIVTGYNGWSKIQISALSEIFQYTHSCDIICAVNASRAVLRFQKLLHCLIAFSLCLICFYYILRYDIQVIFLQRIQITNITIFISAAAYISDVSMTKRVI